MLRVSVLYSQVPGLGHIPNLVKNMGSTNNAVVKSAVQVVHLLSANEVRHTIRGWSLIQTSQRKFSYATIF